MYMDTDEYKDRPPGVGDLVRRWRRRRDLTQHALAARGGVSTRYLSFIETGRARPSRSMVARLGETLAVPLDVRNEMLLAAGYAPIFGERELGDPDLKPVRQALVRILAAHEPYPAFVVDRRWNIRATNRGAGLLTAGVGPAALEPNANLIRLLLHPAGFGGRARNTEERTRSLLGRVRRRAEQTCDQELTSLYEELFGYQDSRRDLSAGDGDEQPLTVHRFRAPAKSEELVLFSAVVAFSEARDATVADLSVEAFFPADDATRLALTKGSGRKDHPRRVTQKVNVGT
jgi:transcriptional regulator with XRE-family HTH domain